MCPVKPHLSNDTHSFPPQAFVQGLLCKGTELGTHGPISHGQDTPGMEI